MFIPLKAILEIAFIEVKLTKTRVIQPCLKSYLLLSLKFQAKMQLI